MTDKLKPLPFWPMISRPPTLAEMLMQPPPDWRTQWMQIFGLPTKSGGHEWDNRRRKGAA